MGVVGRTEGEGSVEISNFFGRGFGRLGFVRGRPARARFKRIALGDPAMSWRGPHAVRERERYLAIMTREGRVFTFWKRILCLCSKSKGST